jgi:hypothetical protein
MFAAKKIIPGNGIFAALANAATGQRPFSAFT